MSQSSKSKGAELVNKSAAEFFSEHQQIAGFDNPGKSLFTAIRELVENSLDAAESINVLPNITVIIVERTRIEHNTLHDIHERPTVGSQSSVATDNRPSKSESKEMMYYTITVKDNGSGISPENIGNMLGRVLSGSKHGIRQTRGKFGLGAKMALIWSKKSSGLPISIRSAHSINPDISPSTVSEVTLDIDIYKNSPTILHRANKSNTDQWRGTEITMTIGGYWSTYRSKVLQYFQQLAVITPYANIEANFTCIRDEKRSISLVFDRRSDTMPCTPIEMLPHPRSLNNITLTNLLQRSKSNSLSKFLAKDLCGITSAAASTMIGNIQGLSEDIIPASITANKIAALCQTLHRSDANLIKPPSTAGLSPAGLYNLRLGVMKELQPKLVATFADKPSSHEGHPFIIEGAVSIGGSQLREGINVYRFANRIPLLFETGADVVTQVSTKRINWNSYHIDPRKDNVGVFISIVSTKIPFKGTSKEYIGDDILEIQQSVKRVIQGCCQQLRVGLAKSIALREEQERKKTLVKYIPDIARSLATLLQSTASKRSISSIDSIVPASTLNNNHQPHKYQCLLHDAVDGRLTEDTIVSKLRAAVDKHDADMTIQANLLRDTSDQTTRPSQPMYLMPSTACRDHPIPRWKVMMIGEEATCPISSNIISNSADAYAAMEDGYPGYWQKEVLDGHSTSPTGSNILIKSPWLRVTSAKHALVLVPSLDMTSGYSPAAMGDGQIFKISTCPLLRRNVTSSPTYSD